MTFLQEQDLQLALPAGTSGKKFDTPENHGLSYCMKAVDFIVELQDKLIFIEFKDPEHPSATSEKKEEFIKKFLSEGLDKDLVAKYRDSFLFTWASGNLKKPIHYLVLIASSALTDADLLARTEALRRKLPERGPGGKEWKKPLITHCAVMNIAVWNKMLPQFPVSRVGASG
ncbi:hypothetical protein [Vandammella animalimorsus]|nr:hypothetical protein [Vandammella animalimorsus]